jgi:hypothetical protein
MTQTIRILSLLSICLGLSGAFAADPKAADAKPAAPAAAATAATTAPASAKTAPADKAATAEPDVKKSKSNICHDKTSPGYKQTKNFTGYKTMDECVKSGGRPPKGSK